MKLFSTLNKATCIIIAVVFLVLSAGMFYLMNKDSNVQYLEATATIIEDNYSEEDPSFKVEYTIADKTYTEYLNGYDSSYKKGDTINVKYEVGKPEVVYINTVGSNIIGIVIPTVFAIAALVMLIAAFSKKKVENTAGHQYQFTAKDFNPFASYPKDDNIQPSGEMTTYHYHYSGKFNQGHTLEDLNGAKVCEALLTKFSLFGVSDYDFINYKTGSRRPHTIGKTITSSSSINDFSLHQNSYFKFDDVNIWQYLEQIGVRVEYDMKNLLKPNFIIKSGEYTIGKLYSTSVKYDSSSILVAKGFFIVEADEMYLDKVFLAAVAFSRTEFNYRID